MTQMEKNLRKGIALVIGAYVVVVVATLVGPKIFNELTPDQAFGRAGALMVFVTIMAEACLHVAWGGGKPSGSFHDANEIPNDQDRHIKLTGRAKVAAHITMLTATLIWGYGDLIYPWIQQIKLIPCS